MKRITLFGTLCLMVFSSFAADYSISFTASGVSSAIDNVVVQTLSCRMFFRWLKLALVAGICNPSFLYYKDLQSAKFKYYIKIVIFAQ